MKKLGLPSVVATGMGLIVATSCLLSLGQGAGGVGVTFIIAMAIACLVNICTALSNAELNALMPNLTGGLAQYTLTSFGPFISIVTVVGATIVCNAFTGSAECAMFGASVNAAFDTPVPSVVYSVGLIVVLMIVNLNGVDMFAKIQNVVSYGLVISLVLMGFMGIFGVAPGEKVSQSWVVSSDFSEVVSMVGLAFFLFLGAEFIIPIAGKVKNPRRNVPLGMVLSLLVVFLMQVIVVLGMHNYVPWAELSASSSPHILFGTNLLGTTGTFWMIIVSVFAVVSTANTVISSIPFICAGMAKIGLLPEFFLKQNKKGAPYIGILMMGFVMILVNCTGLTTSSQISFYILAGCIFWMISYIITNINVLILRKRMPKAPRTFKVPGGILIPLIGIMGNIFMILHIDGDPAVASAIYKICAALYILIGLYAALWVKFVLKKKFFVPSPLHEVMAMENELYLIVRRKKRSALS